MLENKLKRVTLKIKGNTTVAKEIADDIFSGIFKSFFENWQNKYDYIENSLISTFYNKLDNITELTYEFGACPYFTKEKQNEPDESEMC